jgi:predicted amidohydrolase
MSNKVSICAAQMGPSSFSNGQVDKKANVQRILSLLEKAIQEKVKIICFPELSLTNYFAVRMNRNYEGFFDQIPNDLTKDIFSLSREKSISIILPYAEFDGVAYYNTAGVIQQGKLIGKYRKTHIPSAFVAAEVGLGNFEKQYFAPGNLGYPVFDLQGVKVGVQICYDRHFPEGYRALALKGAQLVFNPTALPYRGLEWRKTTWETFLRVRSFENNLFVAGVNKGGLEEGLDFAGDTLVISPIGGMVMAKSHTKGDELITVEIDLDEIIEAKKILPVFRDRRPTEYTPITE